MTNDQDNNHIEVIELLNKKISFNGKVRSVVTVIGTALLTTISVTWVVGNQYNRIWNALNQNTQAISDTKAVNDKQNREIEAIKDQLFEYFKNRK